MDFAAVGRTARRAARDGVYRRAGLAVLVGSAALAWGARPTEAGVPPDAAALAEVRAMMERSAGAWNRGDLDSFMQDYVPGGEATYVTPRGVVRGAAAIQARYAPRFKPGASRGTLHFEDLEVDRLAPGVVNAIAYYVLTERTAAGADSVVARGPTSLVMRKADGRWRIVHDHSS